MESGAGLSLFIILPREGSIDNGNFGTDDHLNGVMALQAVSIFVPLQTLNVLLIITSGRNDRFLSNKDHFKTYFYYFTNSTIFCAIFF